MGGLTSGKPGDGGEERVSYGRSGHVFEGDVELQWLNFPGTGGLPKAFGGHEGVLHEHGYGHGADSSRDRRNMRSNCRGRSKMHISN